MENKTRKNVIIFVVDSARYYSTGGKDDRDKLKMMDDFEKESIYFSTAVSSAPSSVMSCASMLTGLPAYYIAPNYEDYKYDNDLFISLPKILSSHGYEIRSNFVAREMRDIYGTIIPQIDRQYWTGDITENTQIENLGFVWSNNQINDVLENYLDKRSSKKPLFLLNWYNIRLDPNTSQEVLRGIKALKKANLWDNSVFFLLADHGYIDPSRGYTPKKLKEMGLTHDLVLYDDNIRIPFFIKYPNCIPNKIDTQISTYDMLPTILDLLNLPLPENMGYKLYGKSLLNLINQSDKQYQHFEKVRTDGRFFAQNDRCTSIRSNTYKYIIRPDTNDREFYNLASDPKEVNNQIDNKNYDTIISKFHNYYEQTEKDAISFQTRYLLSKLIKNEEIKAYNQKEVKILFFAFGGNYFNSIISSVLEEVFNKSIYYVLLQNKESIDNYDIRGNVLSFNLNDTFLLYDVKKKNNLSSKTVFDLIIGLTDINDNMVNIKDEIMRKIIYKECITINPDMNMLESLKEKNKFSYLFKIMLKKSKYYRTNPRYFLTHLRIGIKRLLQGS